MAIGRIRRGPISVSISACARSRDSGQESVGTDLSGGAIPIPGGAGTDGAETLWGRMTVFVVLGIILTVAGLVGVLWCIRAATRLKRTELSDDAVREAIRRLVLGHTTAIGAAFLGLGLLLVGLLLQ